jgi:hypothetical protein
MMRGVPKRRKHPIAVLTRGKSADGHGSRSAQPTTVKWRLISYLRNHPPKLIGSTARYASSRLVTRRPRKATETPAFIGLRAVSLSAAETHDEKLSDWAEREIPDRRWVVPEWIPREQVTGLYGAGGINKTDFLTVPR